MSENMLYDWLDKWLAVYAKNKVGDSTYNTYRCSVVNLKRVVEDEPLENVKEVDMQCAINVLCDLGYSKSTLHTVIVVLNMAFNKACKNGLITMNPCEDLYIPKQAPTKQVDALTIEEQACVEQACRGMLHGEKYRFLLLTGLRQSEMRLLQWSDYSYANKKIFIRNSKTKNGIRVLPLLPEAQAIIEMQPKINDYIFNSSKGEPITASVLKKTYLRLRKATGISMLTNHICRHTFATRLLEAGAEAKALSSLLGHASAAFTLTRYVHTQEQYLVKQMELLSNTRNPKTECTL